MRRIFTCHANSPLSFAVSSSMSQICTMSPISDNDLVERVSEKHADLQAGHSDAPIVTAISTVPVTVFRQPYLPGTDDSLPEAGVPRANVAPSKEQPNGTTEHNYAEEHKHQTVLQQHCDYFDSDGDGIIWPRDTYVGCRKWGWNPVLSVIAMFIIHAGLSYATLPGWLPDPFFRLYQERMHKNKHGSSSEGYDNEGRFRPQQFEDIFAKFDASRKGGLTIGDTWRFWNASRMAMDFWGWSATGLEWVATWLLIWPEDGVMKKEDIRGIYDGSVFYKKAKEHEKRTAMKGNKSKMVKG